VSGLDGDGLRVGGGIVRAVDDEVVVKVDNGIIIEMGDGMMVEIGSDDEEVAVPSVVLEASDDGDDIVIGVGGVTIDEGVMIEELGTLVVVVEVVEGSASGLVVGVFT
jgi:hypothetical protein